MGRKSNLQDRILRDMENKLNVTVQTMAAELSFQIESAYENAISLFYADYPDPLVYQRTYSTFLASNGYNDPFSPNNLYKTGDIWTAGIQVDHSFIPGNPYKADKDWVFDRTFNKGIHGINIRTVRHRNATLWKKDKQKRLLAKYFSKLNKNQKKIKVKTKGLIPLRQTLGTLSVQNLAIPKNMKHPPRKIMNKSFKEITNKRSMDNLFEDIFISMK